jgi:uncharacterized PurR-regulated membrane protein YhhQ (DUF165 family)
MRFSKLVFGVAGVWGLLIMMPLFWLRDAIGRQYPPPVTHPDIYYGFVCVTLAWQLAFLLIATDPIRYRLIMLAAMVEKFSYVIAMTTLYLNHDLQIGQYAVAGPDFILGILFVVAFLKTQ